MTTTLTCPRCSTSFETEAVTDTRCRHCRTVVRVPRSVDSTTGAPSPSTPRAPVQVPDPEDIEAADAGPDFPPPAVVVLLGGAILVALVVRAFRRARRPSPGWARPSVAIRPVVTNPDTYDPAPATPTP